MRLVEDGEKTFTSLSNTLMKSITPSLMTTDEWRAVAVAAINKLIGDETYEMCRLYFEEAVPHSMLGVRFELTRSGVTKRILTATTTLRHLSIASGVNLLPPRWEARIVREQTGQAA